MTIVTMLMTRGGETIAAEATVRQAARKIAQSGVSHLLVTGDARRLLGVVCVCDLDGANHDALLRQRLTTRPVTIEAHASAADAAALMSSFHVSCLPVVSAGQLCGVITLHDLRRYGFADADAVRCSACGSEDHVRSGFHGSPLGLCLECTRRSCPPDPDDELGVGD